MAFECSGATIKDWLGRLVSTARTHSLERIACHTSCCIWVLVSWARLLWQNYRILTQYLQQGCSSRRTRNLICNMPVPRWCDILFPDIQDVMFHSWHFIITHKISRLKRSEDSTESMIMLYCRKLTDWVGLKRLAWNRLDWPLPTARDTRWNPKAVALNFQLFNTLSYPNTWPARWTAILCLWSSQLPW
jgi:hypothetical protein